MNEIKQPTFEELREDFLVTLSSMTREQQLLNFFMYVDINRSEMGEAPLRDRERKKLTDNISAMEDDDRVAELVWGAFLTFMRNRQKKKASLS